MPLKPLSKVRFFYEHSFTLTDRSKLKLFIENIFRNEEKELESLNYVFVTEKRLLEINRQYLAHDFYTDIITFDLSASRKLCVGEIYISVPRVRDNAKTLHLTFSQEMRRVIIHGALHLCGYKDKTPGQQNSMRAREEFYLDSYD